MGKVKIVSASAGSGKTYNLAYEYVRNVIDNPMLYRHILAVTFTNKATEEMKQRILGKLNELATGKSKDYIKDLRRDLNFSDNIIESRAKEARSRILHDYNHFAVLTIDKFFQRIIRSFIKELGIDINFNIELPTETLLSSATDRLIDESVQDESLRRWLTDFVNERIDDSKQWSIKQEIESLGEEVFKERFREAAVNMSRAEIESLVKMVIIEGEKSKKNIESIARQAHSLLEKHGLSAEDFTQKMKGVGGFISKNAVGDLMYPNNYVNKALSEDSWYPGKSDKRNVIENILPELKPLVQSLAEACALGITKIQSATLIRRNFRSFALLGDLKKRIADLSAEENLIHISEINTMLAELIKENDTPFIFEKAGNYYSHYMIDEFQDTSSLQWKNFIPLLKNAISQSDKTPVMLVGDVKQSIYRWRGGDWKILAQAAIDEFDDVESMSLLKNYRSSGTVVNFNNAIIEAVINAESHAISTALSSASKENAISDDLAEELTGLAAKAYSDYIQESEHKYQGGYATITYYTKNEDGKARPPLIKRIEELQARGYNAGDIAILVRTNTQAAQIANTLLEHKSANPQSPYSYDVISQDALIIGKSPVCIFVAACMHLASDPEDTINRAIYNGRLEIPFDKKLNDDDLSFFERIRLQSPEEAFEAIVIRYSLGSNPIEAAYLQALHEQIISFVSSNIADIPLFMEWWEEAGSHKSISMPSGGNAIAIDTIHRSKGLEYPVVILPYCNWSMNTKADSVIWSGTTQKQKIVSSENNNDGIKLFPVGYSKDMADSIFAEDFYKEYVMSHIDNLNLFYVALTRAIAEIHVMMPEPSKKSSSETISKLISECLTVNGEQVAVNGHQGKVINENDGNTVFQFGFASEATIHKDKSDNEIIGIDFKSVPIGERIKISLSSQKYIDDGAGDGRLSPRDYGILMHRVFESARSLEEIRSNILMLTENGEVSIYEAQELTEKIDTAFSDARVAEWFSNSWDEVRNENDILIPGESSYRPDRVMISGKRAVVLDYKFGLREDGGHRRQTENYMSVLGKMGYEAEGYIWYVALNKIVTVKP